MREDKSDPAPDLFKELEDAHRWFVALKEETAREWWNLVREEERNRPEIPEWARVFPEEVPPDTNQPPEAAG